MLSWFKKKKPEAAPEVAASDTMTGNYNPEMSRRVFGMIVEEMLSPPPVREAAPETAAEKAEEATGQGKYNAKMSRQIGQMVIGEIMRAHERKAAGNDNGPDADAKPVNLPAR